MMADIQLDPRESTPGGFSNLTGIKRKLKPGAHIELGRRFIKPVVGRPVGTPVKKPMPPSYKPPGNLEKMPWIGPKPLPRLKPRPGLPLNPVKKPLPPGRVGIPERNMPPGGYKNYGQQRSKYVHLRNAKRKAQKANDFREKRGDYSTQPVGKPVVKPKVDVTKAAQRRLKKYKGKYAGPDKYKGKVPKHLRNKYKGKYFGKEKNRGRA